MPEPTRGRLAGALYLAVVITGIFSLAYVPSQIETGKDIEASIRHITASETLFRLGIGSLLINQIAFLLLPLALFQLLQGVSRRAAIAMVALAVAGIPVALAGAAHKLDILSLVAGNMQTDQLYVQVTSALAAYRSNLLIANLFWGLWLLPLGYLILRSRYLPRILGIFLVLGCLGYCVDVFGTILVPGYSDSALSSYATLPAAVGEIGTALWLLVVGARVPRGAASLVGT
jgi:hypothetical protein